MSITVFWFRRDLRLKDNHGLYKALQSSQAVLPLFIFDHSILDELDDKRDARVQFIYEQLVKINTQLKSLGKALIVKQGNVLEVWQQLLEEFPISQVFTNRDYEPYAQQRDRSVYALLKQHNIDFKGFKDQVIFEKEEVVKQDGSPYTVFTPYSKRWHQLLTAEHVQHYPSEDYLHHFLSNEYVLPQLEELGFKPSSIRVRHYDLSPELLLNYEEQRNRPDLNGTSYISPHLRFGTISIREVYRRSKDYSSSFINELIWRDFYSQVLYHFPDVVTHNFKRQYDAIIWRNNEEEFQKWCMGKTGFPIVDAGMRQLNQTGWMHNRVRMITASFLVKDLLIDWRWGEAYFAEKLLDYDLASNNGGWQWAAGTGTDAAPYFRIFNPDSQLKKFDPQHHYVKKWIREWNSAHYPEEMVDHSAARLRALEVYKQALNKK